MSKQYCYVIVFDRIDAYIMTKQTECFVFYDAAWGKDRRMRINDGTDKDGMFVSWDSACAALVDNRREELAASKRRVDHARSKLETALQVKQLDTILPQ